MLPVLAVSCAKEKLVPEPVSPVGDDAVAIEIDGEIRQVATKASANGFDNGDALGLFAVNYSNNNAEAGVLKASGNQADNAQYVFDQANYKWTPLKPVYYKDINTDVDLYCYYPYQKNIDDVNAYNFEVKQDQSSERTASELGGYEASDLLWGKTTNVTPTESRVKIKLGHIMAGVQVNLVEGTGFAEGEYDLIAKTVLVNGTSRKAELDFATGVVTPVGSAQATGIVMAPQGDGSFRAVVVPQSVAAGEKLFSISLGSVSYGYRQSDATVEYAAGKLTSFTIRLNRKVPSGEIELVLTDTRIIDWVEDRNTHGGEAKQYYVVNVPQPGHLGRTIKAAKKNPDKIKNLKVVGTVNDNDFYFMRDSMAILEAVNMKEAVLRCMDSDHYSPHDEYVYGYSQEEKDRYIQQYGEPDLIDYSSGQEYIYHWYSEEAKGAYIPTRAFESKSSLYYFVFPEKVEGICSRAFQYSNISGQLVISDDVSFIGYYAFGNARMITGVSWPNSLHTIEVEAFTQCSSLSGRIIFPDNLTIIGYGAFRETGISGVLFPDNLEIIGGSAFERCSNLTGSISIPEKVDVIPSYCFTACTNLNGQLYLNNVTQIQMYAFNRCGFQGELVIPEGTLSIDESAFASNSFSSVIFPSTIKRIGNSAFYENARLDSIMFPEGLMTIEKDAFTACSTLLSVDFPSTLLSIGSGAFARCYGVSSITCKAEQVPNVMSGAFDGISKDSFTLEVPESSVTRYQAATGWDDFRRIGGHYDFSISRKMMRGLNAEISNTYTLRAPAGFDWSIESKPDWVTVTPDHGTGKEEVTVTFAEMPRTNDPMYNLDNIYEQIGTGRNGEIVFLLNDKDYRSTMVVEQYDSDYQDGQAMPIETASKGNGIDIIYIGDGYDARDIATGKFRTDVENGNTAFFGLEPYATYKDYFNVYAVVSMSKDSGIGTVNTVVDTKFGSYFTQNRILAPNASDCFAWANKAKSGIDFSKSLVIMLQNASVYEGVTMMYGDGSAIACCPISADAYPYDFRGIIQHEAGGHGFGKLGDEYIYHGAFIQTCDCVCCEHPENFDAEHARGWYRNLSMESDMKNVPWSHLIFHNKYSDYVDMYEGGYMHSRGVYRSEATSCMNNNIPYYSAISRQAIVERIMEYAGETFDFNAFVAKDSRAFGATKSGAPSTNYQVEMLNDGREHTYPIYMGEHPEF